MKTEGDIVVPTQVQSFVDEIEEANPDHETVVNQPRPGRWRITFEAPRVLLTIDFRLSPGSWKARWCGSQLLVDGKPHDYVSNGEALAALVADPDGVPEPWPISTAMPVEEAPALVARCYRDLEGRVGDSTISLGQRDDGAWLIGLDGSHGTIRLRFRQVEGGAWILPGTGLQLIVDGVDRTDQAAGDIEKALGLFHEAEPKPETPKKTGHDHTTVGAKANSVAVRRSTVIRV